jgi:hypothetical protein
MGSVTNEMPKRVVARASKSWLTLLKRSNGYDDGSPQPRSAEDITVSACEDTRRYAGSSEKCHGKTIGRVTNRMPKRVAARARAKAGSRC